MFICPFWVKHFALSFNVSFLVFRHCGMQRWSPRGRPWPRGHILKSLALASKVKSLVLASRHQVLENWPVLGSGTAVFFELLKFCGALEKFYRKRFFVEIARKIFVKTFSFFFWRALALVSLVLGLEHSCPWPRECLSSERLSLALASDFFLCPWPWPRALRPRLHLWWYATQGMQLTGFRKFFTVFCLFWN